MSEVYAPSLLSGTPENIENLSIWGKRMGNYTRVNVPALEEAR
jgi:hypothetical protein